MAQETSDGVPISDGFDFPVGPRGADVDVFKTHKVDTILVDPDYYRQLGYWHPGEDWNGRGGGNTDLGDPIYAIANGKVLRFGHFPVWGNIVLLEHALPDSSRVWSQYAHLDTIKVNQIGQKVTRGQQVGTMGRGDNNRFVAHLHFEIRRNKLPIDNWSPMVKNKQAVLDNYYNPTEFIKAHRPVKEVETAESIPQVEIPQLTQLVINVQQSNPQAGTFRRTQNGNWYKAPYGYFGDMLWTQTSAQQETDIAEWRPNLTKPGRWEVWTFIPANNATTTYARYKILHAAGQSEVPVNQWGNRNQWVNLGTYRFAQSGGYVRLGNFTGELGVQLAVGFDTICWTSAD